MNNNWNNIKTVEDNTPVFTFEDKDTGIEFEAFTVNAWKNNGDFDNVGIFPCDSGKQEAELNAALFSGALVVRKQINCSLPELLERFKAMEGTLKTVLKLRGLIEYPEPPETKPEHYDEGRSIAMLISIIEELLSTKTVVE